MLIKGLKTEKEKSPALCAAPTQEEILRRLSSSQAPTFTNAAGGGWDAAPAFNDIAGNVGSMLFHQHTEAEDGPSQAASSMRYNTGQPTSAGQSWGTACQSKSSTDQLGNVTSAADSFVPESSKPATFLAQLATAEGPGMAGGRQVSDAAAQVKVGVGILGEGWGALQAGDPAQIFASLFVTPSTPVKTI